MSRRAAWLLPPVLPLLAFFWFMGGGPPGAGREREECGRRPDQPGEAARFRWLRQIDESGRIPAGALLAAKHQRDALLAADPAGIGPSDWTWLGPRNIGGRIRAILVHPTQPNTLWIGSASGGIWKTTDGGATWRAQDDFVASLAVGCMAIDPANPNLLFAGTGEGFFNIHAVRGAGIFRSQDGGGTWQQIASTSGADWYFVNRIALHPTDARILLAATNSGIYRTTDGAATWTRTYASRTGDLKFHPTDGMRAVAGTFDGTPIYSTDGGVTWTAAAGLPGNGQRVELAYARANPQVVYASIARFTAAAGYTTQGLYRSVNGGQDYNAANIATAYLGTQGWYDNAVWVDPTDVLGRTVVVGGTDLWRSTDGGSTLTQVSDWRRVPNPGDSAHADHHVIVHHPGFNGTTNKTVFFGNDGGIYRTDDVYAVATSAGWNNLNQDLGITQFYGAAVNRATGVILGGTQDNATLRRAGAALDWAATGFQVGAGLAYTGDGGFCASDGGAPGNFYGEFPLCEVFRSSDGGLTSRAIHNVGANRLTDAGNAATANFIAPILVDPNDGNRLLAGAAQLWRCANPRDATPAWASIKAADVALISAVAVAEGNSDIIWVGHNNGDVYRTANGTQAAPVWVKVDDNAVALPNRYCTRIAIDPRSAVRAYVTFGGFSADNVWRTTDSGGSWTQITGSGTAALPSLPVYSILLDRQQAGALYLGTELGVFTSTDDGASWTTSTRGPVNVSVDELVWRSDTELMAVTYGRGLYVADVSQRVVGRTTRVSLSSAQVPANDGCFLPSISADGRCVAFQSQASNLVPNDTNGNTDIFVHDRKTGLTTRVSVDSAGTQANDSSYNAVISGDGRYVAFESWASNLIPRDTNPYTDVFVHDRKLGKTTCVSVSSTGVQGAYFSNLPSISADGRYVAFESFASNLVPNDTNGWSDVFVHDRQTGGTTRVSVGAAGVQGNANSSDPSISANGRFVVFESIATNLVLSDTNAFVDVFLHDRETGTTTRVSVDSAGAQVDFGGADPVVSADGSFVAFLSYATTLVPNDTNGNSDIFVYDRRASPGRTTRVSVSSALAQAFGNSSLPGITPDGRFVVFQSAASNLVADDNNGWDDVFVHDRLTARTTRASLSYLGEQGNGGSASGAISDDGRAVAFSSWSSNLVPNDNSTQDIFVFERLPTLETTDAAKIGNAVRLQAFAPDDPGRVYVMAASGGTSPGIPIDTRVIPLNADDLFLLSLYTPAIFENFIGTLDATGRATGTIRIPPDASLVNIVFYAGFFTLRPGAPSGIGAISLPVRLRIVP